MHDRFYHFLFNFLSISVVGFVMLSLLFMRRKKGKKKGREGRRERERKKKDNLRTSWRGVVLCYRRRVRTIASSE